MIKNIIKLLSMLTVIALLLCLTACNTVRGSLKKEIPEAEYTSFGYAVKSSISGDKLTLAYALVGFKDETITNVYLDKIEKTLGDEKSSSTNKEMGTAYGLVYESELGEFNVQLNALQNYIMGHKMTVKEVNEIETYQKDEQNPSLPKEGTDLAVACGLNIGEYIELINEAAENRVEQECMKIGLGEQIFIRNVKNEIIVSFAVIATDYRSKLVYSFLDMYKAVKGADEIKSEKQRSEESPEILEWVRNIEGYEGFMLGRNIGDSAGVPTYNTGDGTTMAIPSPDTDLAAVCNVDIGYFKDVLYEASNRSK